MNLLKSICGSCKVNLVVDEENLLDEQEISQTSNNYLNNTLKSLNLQFDPKHLNGVSDENNPIERASNRIDTPYNYIIDFLFYKMNSQTL